MHSLKVEDVQLFQDKSVINFSDKHKHSRPGFHNEPAGILDFAQNHKCCIVDHLKLHLEKTEKLSKRKDYFFQKPHTAVSRKICQVVEEHTPTGRCRHFFSET